MTIDGATLLAALAAAGVLFWMALATVRAGQLQTWAGPVIRRAERPVYFWFGVWLAFALAAFFLIVAIAVAGKLGGLWTFPAGWSADLAADGASLVVALATAGFLASMALHNVRTGEIATISARTLSRANDPGGFWFAIALSLALAGFFIALGVATFGRLAGWWEFRL